jgi:hypothetical protein
MKYYISLIPLVTLLLVGISNLHLAKSLADDININVSCLLASGRVVSQNRPVSGFSSVLLNGTGKLIIEQSGTESLTVTADDNVQPLITSEVRDGRLVLDIKSCIQNPREITYKVTVKDLQRVKISGAADANIQMVNANRLEVNVDGAANITASGKTNQLDIITSGNGKFQGEKLESSTAKVDVSGNERC